MLVTSPPSPKYVTVCSVVIISILILTQVLLTEEEFEWDIAGNNLTVSALGMTCFTLGAECDLVVPPRHCCPGRHPYTQDRET